ncbi:MAG: hypothetical protein V4819_25435 [Verrucomicrobiota bacterium]
MTPNPPSSPDGSGLPPRHRPSLSNLPKDTTEQDLWAFDDMDSEEEEVTEAPPKSPEPGIPVPRDTGKMKIRQLGDQPPPKTGGDSIRVNVGIGRPKIPTPSATGQSQPGSEFDDLDHWDEPEATHPVSETPAATGAIPAMPTPPAIAKTPPPDTAPADPRDEFSPPARDKATPVPLRPRLNLTKLEGAGLLALVALLLIGGAMVFLNTIHRLPSDSGRVKANDFPIRGSHLAIVSADSFWRAPKTADTVRRGTQLIPVVDLTTSGGPGAIRVFFRNSDGDVIGDAVTRFLKVDGKLQIAATAGFDDAGMHAAYRTGDNDPWTIEVLEAPTENTPGPEFRKLFEMDVSTDRR